MWPWSSKTSLNDIEEHLIRFETRLKAVEVEWDDTYEKIRRTLARINHRYGKVEAAEAAHKESAQQDLLPVPTNGQAGRLLTERQKELQQQILRRRAGGN
jgi:DNA repair exonuclease SbcCD ATPase subunit